MLWQSPAINTCLTFKLLKYIIQQEFESYTEDYYELTTLIGVPEIKKINNFVVKNQIISLFYPYGSVLLFVTNNDYRN